MTVFSPVERVSCTGASFGGADRGPVAFRLGLTCRLSRKRALLVVEMKVATLFWIAYLLRDEYEVVTATCADEALVQVSARSFDGFILGTDLGPVYSGIDLLHTLREMPCHREAPAVACTDFDPPGNRARYLEAGFDDYVIEPITKIELLKAIDHALANGHTGERPMDLGDGYPSSAI